MYRTCCCIMFLLFIISLNIVCSYNKSIGLFSSVHENLMLCAKFEGLIASGCQVMLSELEVDKINICVFLFYGILNFVFLLINLGINITKLK